MPAFIHIQANGENLQGRSIYSELAGVDLVDHTQIVSLYQDTGLAGSTTGSSRATSRITTGPFSVVKALDGISPALQKALQRNHTINAKIIFFDKNFDTGSDRHAYSIVLLQGRITNVRYEMQHTGSTDIHLPLERVTILPQVVRHTSEPTSAEFEYNQADLA